MIENAILQFRLNIKSVKDLNTIVDSVHTFAPVMDLSEVVRAEIVLAVSAFDCFIHDLVRLGTLEIYKGTRPYDQKKTLKPEFEMPKLHNLMTKSKEEQMVALDQEFRRIFKTKTFQEPTIIEKNLICIGIENVWFELGLKMGIEKTDLMRKIDLIMSRRNAIVHEADIDAAGRIGQKNLIYKEIILENVLFLETVCEKIYEMAVA